MKSTVNCLLALGQPGQPVSAAAGSCGIIGNKNRFFGGLAFVCPDFWI